MSAVKVFRSTDAGAPQVNNVAGAFITMLDAVLVNGYNTKTITITRSGTTATATSVAHGYSSTPGTVLLHAGADQTEYNGLFRIFNVTADTYDFTVTGTPATPATGTISAKVAPAGWTKPYSGTNIAAYRTGGGNQFYLRVNDTTTTYATHWGYEAMTAADVGTMGFGTGYHHKSSDATASPWIIVATDKLMYFFADAQRDSSSGCMCVFGDIKSYKAGDAYGTIHVGGGVTTLSSMCRFNLLESSSQAAVTANHTLARSYTQLNGAIGFLKTAGYAIGVQSSYGAASGGLQFPNPVDGGMYMHKTHLFEAAVLARSIFRGELPGAWSVLHYRPVSHLSIVNGAGDTLGRQFLAINMYNLSQVFIEISDTWDT